MIKVYRLTTGEDLIADELDSNDKTIKVKKPFVLIPATSTRTSSFSRVCTIQPICKRRCNRSKEQQYNFRGCSETRIGKCI